MESILESLKKITIPKNCKRPNVSGLKYVGADKRKYGFPIESVTLGSVRDWQTGYKTISKFTLENLELYELLLEYGKTICPHPIESICLNHNVMCQKHVDRNNKGMSTIVGLGDYTNGQLWVEGQVVDIHNKPFTFDGSKYYHYTLPFEGDRYTLIFFN